MHDFAVKLHIHPLNRKNLRGGDGICRKFATVCITSEGDDLPETVEMRLVLREALDLVASNVTIKR